MPLTLRQARIAKEYSQADLAGLAGVSAGTIHRAENEKPVSKGTLQKICAVLDVQISDLAGLNIFVPVRDRHRNV